MLDENIPQPWQGQTTLVFALAAGAVGAGNLFRVPFLMGEHGGAPFFLAYVATLFLVAVPVLTAEVVLGSQGRGSPLGSLRWAADQSGLSTHWGLLGLAQCLLGLVLAAYCLPLLSWLVDRAVVLNLDTLAAASPAEVVTSYDQMVNTVHWLTLGTLLLGVVVLAALGPRVSMTLIGWVALPGMAVAMGSVLRYSVNFGDLEAAGRWLFVANYKTFDWGSAMAGMVSGALTLLAGLGVGSAFGARSPQRLPLLRAVCAAAVIDTAFLIATAAVVIALLGETNVLPSEGLALVFVALPYAFANLPLGEIYGALFFGFAALALFATLVALIEPSVMVLRQELDLHRSLGAILVGLLTGMVSLVLLWKTSATALLADSLNMAIVSVWLLLAVFVGWLMPRPLVRGELFREPRWLFEVWWVCLRLIVPASALTLLLWQLSRLG